MKTELYIKLGFRASHSMPGYDAPHFHHWKIDVAVGGEPRNGKLVDMVVLRAEMDRILRPMEGVYLNDFPGVSEAVRRHPTCETLAPFLIESFDGILKAHSENPTLKTQSVQVTLIDDDGTERGAVRVWSSSA